MLCIVRRSVFGVFFTLVCIFASSFFFIEEARSEETYNFYFQKQIPAAPKGESDAALPLVPAGSGSATTSVPASSAATSPQSTALPAISNTPVGTAAASSSPSPSGASTANPTVLPIVPQANRNFSFGLGYGTISDLRFGVYGLNIVGGYEFNRYLGIYGELLVAEKISPRPSQIFYPSEASPGTDESVSLVLTPLNISMFGSSFIDIGILAGVMTLSEESACSEPNSCEYVRKFAPFWGPVVTVNLGERIATTTAVKFPPAKYPYPGLTASYSLKYRF